MKKALLSVFAFIVLQFSTSVWAKTYLCGVSGVLIKSTTPCKIPETDLSLSPIKADRIDAEVINKSMALYRVAVEKRDIHAFDRFLSKKFTFESYRGSWDGKLVYQVDKTGFLELSKLQLLAMTDLQQTIHRFSVKRIQGFLIAETLSTDKVFIGEDKFEGRILERVLLEIENGAAKIRAIKQIEY